ncbi:MAG: hypothetical protein ACLT98_01475 [Eggerthellaceae bacterium]
MTGHAVHDEIGDAEAFGYFRLSSSTSSMQSPWAMKMVEMLARWRFSPWSTRL